MLIEQIQKGESKTLELKRALPQNDSIAKTVIAFSNTSGGKLIVGVNDQLEIIGIDDSKLFDIQDKIASIIFNNCSPGIMPEIYSVNIKTKLVLVIEVVRGNLKPYFLKGQGKANGTYVRIGATNRPADFDTITELERQKRHMSFDEEICYDMEFADVDISPLIEKFKEIGKPLDTDKHVNLKLVKHENGKIALAFTNSSFNPAVDIELLLRTKTRSIKLSDMNCNESVIQSSGSDGHYQKFIIPFVDPWQIRLVEEN